MITSIHDATAASPERSAADRSRYLGGSRGKAVRTLIQAITDQEVLVLLTGPAGAGKTIVVDAALTALAAAATSVTRLSNPSQDPWSQSDLGRRLLGPAIDDPASQAADVAVGSLSHRDLAALIAERLAGAAGITRVVIAIDDAHTLTDDAIELLFLLASPLRGIDTPPQLILAGRGAFWERDKSSELLVIARLAERVILNPLTGADAMEYSEFSLSRISGSHLDISADALTRIVDYAGGLPALIDQILAPANAIRVCRGDRVLTDDIVEAAIATMAPVPGTSVLDEAFPDPAPITPAAEGAPFVGWNHPPRPIDLAALLSNVISAANEESISAPDSRPRMRDPGLPPVDLDARVLDPEPSYFVVPMVPSPTERRAVTPILVPRPVETMSAPKRWRLGRAATAAANFVLLIGGLAGVISVPSTQLAKAIWWPSSTAAVATRADYPPSAVAEEKQAVVTPVPAAIDRDLASAGPASPSPVLAEPSVAVAAAVSADRPPDEPATKTAPAKAPDQIATAPQAPPPTVAVLSPAMVTFLLARGDLLLQQGDVRSARLYFEQAAEAGSQQGAVGAAKTYDPAFLATVHSPSPDSDVARAIRWYQMASTTFGDRYASERLQALAAPADK